MSGINEIALTILKKYVKLKVFFDLFIKIYNVQLNNKKNE
jgi:hypothetical protein